MHAMCMRYVLNGVYGVGVWSVYVCGVCTVCMHYVCGVCVVCMCMVYMHACGVCGVCMVGM